MASDLHSNRLPRRSDHDSANPRHEDWPSPGPEAGSVRSRRARAAAETALVRIVHHYGSADLRDQRTEATIKFDKCQSLGALNLRGTGYASHQTEVREFSARIGGVMHTVEVNVSGLPGFLLAKIAAAYSRRKPMIRTPGRRNSLFPGI